MLAMNPNLVVAFFGSKSTAHMVNIARAAGLEVWEPDVKKYFSIHHKEYIKLMSWQPYETAPITGEPFLAYFEGLNNPYAIIYWHGITDKEASGFKFSNGTDVINKWMFSRWMPLPEKLSDSQSRVDIRAIVRDHEIRMARKNVINFWKCLTNAIKEGISYFVLVFLILSSFYCLFPHVLGVAITDAGFEVVGWLSLAVGVMGFFQGWNKE